MSCSICQIDPERKRDVVTLGCGHTFCYGCIYEWYANIRLGTTSYEPHSCPMCFQDGGLLPLREGYERIYLVNSDRKCDDGNAMNVDKIHMFYNSCKCIHPVTGEYCKRGGMEEIRPVNKGFSIFICATHYEQFRKGEDLQHKCLGFLESSYQKVPCEHRGCEKMIIKKFVLTVQKKYRVNLCHEHRKIFRTGKTIPMKSGMKLTFSS